jgi:hypothetical protein
MTDFKKKKWRSINGLRLLDELQADPDYLQRQVETLVAQFQPERLRAEHHKTLAQLRRFGEKGKQSTKDEEWLRKKLGPGILAGLEAAGSIYWMNYPLLFEDLEAAKRLREFGLIDSDQPCFDQDLIAKLRKGIKDGQRYLERGNWKYCPETFTIKYQVDSTGGRPQTFLGAIVAAVIDVTRWKNTQDNRKEIERLLSPYFPSSMLDPKKDKPISNAIDTAIEKQRRTPLDAIRKQRGKT